MTEQLFQLICLQYLNRFYRWGGDDPSGWDCSGLAQELLAVLGLDPPSDQTAQKLYEFFRPLEKDQQCTAGSLVFYGPNLLNISHVAVGFCRNFVIEAGGGGSATLTEADAIRQNAYIRIRPFMYRRDFLKVIRPISLPWLS